MRISIVKGDPGYDNSHTRRVERVTIDGKPVVSVTADDEQGFVDELVMENGRIAQDPRDGSPLTRRVTGQVKIFLRPVNERDWDKTRKGETKVQVGRASNGDILVQVFSNARPGAIKQGRMTLFELPSQSLDIAQKAGLTAGAMAELLCEQFSDRLDPDECARVAVSQTLRMLTAEAEA